MAARDYANDEMYRCAVTIQETNGGRVHNTIFRGPYSKAGTAKGVASQHAGSYIRENERAARSGAPPMYLVDVKIQKATVVWVDV